jgi:hypothetical protein
MRVKHEVFVEHQNVIVGLLVLFQLGFAIINFIDVLERSFFELAFFLYNHCVVKVFIDMGY